MVLLWKPSRIKYTHKKRSQSKHPVSVILMIACLSLAQALSHWSILTLLAERVVAFSVPFLCRIGQTPGLAQVDSAQGFLPLGSTVAVHIFKPNQTETISSLSVQQRTWPLLDVT